MSCRHCAIDGSLDGSRTHSRARERRDHSGVRVKRWPSPSATNPEPAKNPTARVTRHVDYPRAPLDSARPIACPSIHRPSPTRRQARFTARFFISKCKGSTRRKKRTPQPLRVAPRCVLQREPNPGRQQSREPCPPAGPPPIAGPKASRRRKAGRWSHRGRKKCSPVLRARSALDRPCQVCAHPATVVATRLRRKRAHHRENTPAPTGGKRTIRQLSRIRQTVRDSSTLRRQNGPGQSSARA